MTWNNDIASAPRDGLVSNRVTEKAFSGEKLWLVSAQWRGGHNRRVIRLENVFRSEGEAYRNWSELTPENHNAKYGKPSDFDADFKRHPIRIFQEIDNE